MSYKVIATSLLITSFLTACSEHPTLPTNAVTSTISDGIYKQTSVTPSDWGECPKCTITITEESPNIVKIVANNHWSGHATYNKEKGQYSGTWQWETGKGGNYENEIFNCTLINNGKQIIMNVESQKTGLKHSIVYRNIAINNSENKFTDTTQNNKFTINFTSNSKKKILMH